MYSDIAQNLIDTDDYIARQWFVWKTSNPHNLNSFFKSELLPDLDHKILALAVMNNCSYEDAELDIDCNEWLVYTDEEAEKAYKEEILNRVEDNFWSVPSYLRQYIKEDEYASDLELCDRAEILSNTNSEYTQVIEGIKYYLYNR